MIGVRENIETSVSGWGLRRKERKWTDCRRNAVQQKNSNKNLLPSLSGGHFGLRAQWGLTMKTDLADQTFCFDHCPSKVSSNFWFFSWFYFALSVGFCQACRIGLQNSTRFENFRSSMAQRNRAFALRRWPFYRAVVPRRPLAAGPLLLKICHWKRCAVAKGAIVLAGLQTWCQFQLKSKTWKYHFVLICRLKNQIFFWESVWTSERDMLV